MSTQEQNQYAASETLGEEAFWERYEPLEVPGQEGNGSYLREHEDVKDLDIHYVWTVVEGDDGSWVIDAGFHVVNKIGYLVTRNPWVLGTETGYYMDPDDFDELREEDARMADQEGGERAS